MHLRRHGNEEAHHGQCAGADQRLAAGEVVIGLRFHQ
jgi:hypothetical protein